MHRTGARFLKHGSPQCQYAGPHKNGVLVDFDFFQMPVYPHNKLFAPNVEKVIKQISPMNDKVVKCEWVVDQLPQPPQGGYPQPPDVDPDWPYPTEEASLEGSG